MTIDTFVFYELALSGFIAVWIFRYFTGRKEKNSEFEWLGLSAFWGLVILIIVEAIHLPEQQLKDLLGNPFAAGLALSTFGIVLGYMGSRFVRIKLFKRLITYLGKDSEDQSLKF
jgi:hypothetical protein